MFSGELSLLRKYQDHLHERVYKYLEMLRNANWDEMIEGGRSIADSNNSTITVGGPHVDGLGTTGQPVRCSGVTDARLVQGTDDGIVVGEPPACDTGRHHGDITKYRGSNLQRSAGGLHTSFAGLNIVSEVSLPAPVDHAYSNRLKRGASPPSNP